MTVNVSVVKPRRDAIALKEECALVERNACQCILGTEIALSGLYGIICTIVYLMASIVGIKAQCAIPAIEMVLQGSRGYTSCDPLVSTILRCK